MGAKRKSDVASPSKASAETKAARRTSVAETPTPPPPPRPHEAARRRRSAHLASAMVDNEEGNDADDDHADVASGEGTNVGRNPFERRLCVAILEAADSNNLEEARAGLHVVSVGRFAKADQKACACGQKPLQRVFHVRHRGTGKLLDIGAACAKKFKMLGEVEAQEAERALRNLEQLHDNPEAKMLDDLCKLARANGLIVRVESDIIRKAHPENETYIDELKAIVISGLGLVRHDLQGVKEEFSTAGRPTDADCKAILRLAILAERRSLLGAIDLSVVSDGDLHLGRNGTKNLEHSLVAEAVKNGLCQEAKLLLDAVGWDSSHALGSLMQAIRKHDIPFVKDYAAQPNAVFPEAQIARLAVKMHETPRILEILLEWCASKAGPEVKSFLHESLMIACDEAPENTVTQLLSAGAEDKDGSALVRWCARNARNLEIPLEVSGASIAEDLIQKAGARPDSACRLLERACIHFAAAAGDAKLVRVLLKKGASAWDCTSAPPRHEIKCSALAKGGLSSLGRQLPVEVARDSHRDTAEVENNLNDRMKEDVMLARSDDFLPLPHWLEKCFDSIVSRSRGQGGADHKLLRRFAAYVLRLRREPDSCRREADERRRLEEQMREMEENARKEAEEKRLREEQERFEREERQRQIEKEIRRKLEDQRREAEERERARREEQQKRELEERKENLVFVCEEGPQRLGLGCYRGMTFEEVACKDPIYLRRIADGHVKGPESFCQFAKLRLGFLRAEIEFAMSNLHAGRDVLHDEEEKSIEWAELRQLKKKAEIDSRCEDEQREALDVVCKCWDYTLGGKGTYAGKTYADAANDVKFSDWWLSRGPGKDSSFGKFVVAQNKLKLSRSEIEVKRQNRSSSEAAQPHAVKAEDFARMTPLKLKYEMRLRGIAIPKHAFEKEDLVQLLQNCIGVTSSSAATPERKKRKSVMRVVDPERRAALALPALALLASQSEKLFPPGKKYEGHTYLSVMTNHPDFGEWWLNKGPGKEIGFGRFASAWLQFKVTPSEIEEFALEQLELEDSGEQPTKQLCTNTSSIDACLDQSPQTERSIALASLSSSRAKCFPKGKKYGGLTYAYVMANHADFAAWWLNKGPGQETDFGRFASDWLKFKVTVSELETLEQMSAHTSASSSSNTPVANDTTPGALQEVVDDVDETSTPSALETTFGTMSSTSMNEKHDFVQESCTTHMRYDNAIDTDSDDDDLLLQACHDLEAQRSSETNQEHCRAQKLEAQHSGENDEDAMLLEACIKIEGEQMNADVQVSSATVESMPSAPVAALPSAAEENRVELGATLFTFGKYRGQTFEHVLKSEPGYCSWAVKQANPSESMKIFVEWVKSQEM